ncbi:two-component response regulator-like PRR73 [Iris pallida]|uniref:Two-component response regulator-like PRR73 n=1 Tax=Iris pallida TaxID=29817 RepID=A0AAX6EBA7_IRIPA|nr:two-component response regulator-like PRR73 [Iris pallida]
MGGNVPQTNRNGATSKGPVDLNYDRRDGHKRVSDAVSEEEESRINESNGDINDGHRRAATARTIVRPPPQQPPPPQQLSGPVVHWERILPFRTLKVLLVENDDSTRQVVSALLRNCSYEVTAAANGLQAWKILENPANHTDMVLTEVVMPGLSGIALLCKIMSHDTAKNIPVIMMSSNDSMGMVFKCLSKGAVDFLVKPIRKNELKNLWQHVWRRSHSSSGSVESGIQTQKSAKSRSTDDSDNNTSSNDDDDNASIGMKRDGSDNGSATQSSWTKHAVEVDSPRPMSPSDQLADRHDSTCAQVIPESEILYNNWVPMTTDRECHKQKNIADEYMGKDLEIGVPRNPEIHDGSSYLTEKAPTKLPGTSIVNQPEIGEKNEDVLELQGSNTFDEPSTKAADLIGGIANNTDTQILSNIHESPKGFSRISECKEKNNDGSELPSLQLSLKRLRSIGEVRDAAQVDRNVLRRSVQSAFSKYRNSAASTQAPTGYGGSCSPIDNSSEAVKTESTNNMISNSNPAIVKQGSNGSSDNNDMGSTTKNVFTNPSVDKEKAAPVLGVKSMHPSAFHPVQLRTSAPPKVMQEKTDNMAVTTMAGQTIGVQCQVQEKQHNHHHIQSVEQQQQPPEHDDLSHKKHKTVSGQLCGASNVFPAAVEGDAANYSINRSNSGSNHGSNGWKGSIPAVNAGGANIDKCANGLTDKCGVGGGNGSGSGSGSGSGTGMNQKRFAEREAALNKFRQKRKERNFGKKVRYQSRKRLAEQRPRVRGQFVRQNIHEHTSREADS